MIDRMSGTATFQCIFEGQSKVYITDVNRNGIEYELIGGKTWADFFKPNTFDE
jgi:hypothetical protein